MNGPQSLDRRGVLAAIAGASVAVGGVGGALASLSDRETATGALESGVWSGDRIAYTTNGFLHTATQDGGETNPDVGDVDVLGPVEYGFGGDTYHVPYVDGNSDLNLMSPDGSTTSLDTSTQAPRGVSSALATASWDGAPLSVYYAGSNDDRLYRVAPDDGSPTQVADPTDGAVAALGAGDLDGDGDDEFVFLDVNGTVRYVATDGTVGTTGVTPGTNDNYGAGAPASFDGYGVAVPAVDGSAGLGLVDVDGWADTGLTGDSTAKKAPVDGCDFDGDGANEIAYIDNSGRLSYLDDVGGSNTVTGITDASGNDVQADPKRGVL